MDRFGQDPLGEIDTYRRALRYLAGTCNWDGFRTKAGQLFGYLEEIGVKLLRQRLQVIIATVVIGFVAVVAVFGSLGSAGIPFFSKHQDAVAAVVLGVSAVELLLLLELRLYLSLRASRRKQREAAFVDGIEKLARDAVGPDVCGGS